MSPSKKSTLQSLSEDSVGASSFVTIISVAIMGSRWLSSRSFLSHRPLTDDFRQVTSRILSAPTAAVTTAPRQAKVENDPGLPDTKLVEKLNETATAKLAEIVRRYTSGDEGWSGYDEAEIISARELLSRDSTKITR